MPILHTSGRDERVPLFLRPSSQEYRQLRQGGALRSVSAICAGLGKGKVRATWSRTHNWQLELPIFQLDKAIDHVHISWQLCHNKAVGIRPRTSRVLQKLFTKYMDPECF